jgi:glycogen synthase
VKICLVSHEYPPDTARGGIGTQTWNKAQALTRLGHAVHVLSCSARPVAGLHTTELDGVTVHRFEPPGFDVEVNEQATYLLGYSWLVFTHLRALQRLHTFDLVNFPEYGGEGYAYLLDRWPWSWTPVAVQLHGPLAMFAERIGWPERGTDFWRVGTELEGTSIRLADGLLASSANIADFAAEYFEVPRERIDVVHCGIDTDVFSPPEDGPRAARPTVLFVGNIAENKGVVTVLEAVLRLRTEYPRLVLRVAGAGDDDLLPRMERAAREAGAGDALEIVGFVGERSALPELYRHAHVFASPAEHEAGVANVYVEAMACGCPVVAAATGGAPEAVVDGETGFLVPPGDVEATTRALDRVLGDSYAARRLGAAGRRRVEDYFADDRYIGRVLAAYERALAGSRERVRTLEAASL